MPLIRAPGRRLPAVLLSAEPVPFALIISSESYRIIPSFVRMRGIIVKNFINLFVKDAMLKDVVTVSPDMKVREVEALFEKYDYYSFPVLEGGKVIGIVTKLDFLKHFIFTPSSIVPQYDRLLDDNVRAIMNPKVFTMSADTPLTRVLELMVETRIRSFPVVDADNQLLGMISREDIMKMLK